jgi:uncharacterized protein involved in exopolysaccharide biosynthesis/Mrp family chromosome partitioning ATPase
VNSFADIVGSTRVATHLATVSLPYGLSPSQVIRALQRHALLVIVLGVIGAVAAYAYARTLPKHYTASSLIAVEADRLTIPELQGALRTDGGGDPLPLVRTEMQAFNARDLELDVVNRLRLMDVPEFNSDLRPPSLLETLKAKIQSWLPRPPPTGGAVQAGPYEGVVGAVNQAVKVFQDNRSLAIGVSFTSEDPKLASDVVNTLVEEYVRTRSLRRETASQDAHQAMMQRIDQVRLDLENIESRMRDLRNNNEVVLLRAGSIGQQQLEELASIASRTAVERAELETQYQRASALAQKGSSDALASVLGSNTISQLRTQEATASQHVADLSTRYGPGYPRVQSAQAELASVRRQIASEAQRIVASLGTQLRIAREHEADVKQQLEAGRKTAVTAENVRAQLEQLQQDANSRRQLYQMLLERAQQTVLQPGVTEASEIRVLSTAAPPGSPSSPNMKLAAGFGGIAGMLLGCTIALARTRRGDDTAGTLMTLQAMGLNVAATLPASHLGRGPSNLAARVVASPNPPESRAVRALLIAIQRLGRSRAPRGVVFTSAVASDQNPGLQLACALARVAASDGKRVLLIDVNFAGVSAADLLGAPGGDLLAVLLEGEDWREAAVPDAYTSLTVLAARTETGAAAVAAGESAHELLAGVAFQNLLVEAEADLDLVVIAAPDASSHEALLLAQRADLTVLVLGPRVQQSEPAIVAANLLGSASRQPLAVVVFSPKAGERSTA